MNPNQSIASSPSVAQSRWRRSLFTWVAIVFSLIFVEAQAQSSGTGTITGRVLNVRTGDYLRNAVVSVVGTEITTVAEAGGNYRLLNVPVGGVKIKAEYAELDSVELMVVVVAGQTASQDFNLTSKAYDSETLVLDRFVVAGEREGNAKALQEQRTSVNMKTVIAADTFGDVSEGNVGEFVKRMPGIAIDYVEADARQIRTRGMSPKYTLVLMDGAPVASAGSSSIATGRSFELEQLSISSIETIEMSKTPTPDLPATLAGVVNLRSKSAFDTNGRRITFQTNASLNSYDWLRNTPGPDDGKTRKIQPNFSVAYSDVLLNGKLGLQVGINYSRTFAEQKAETVAYTWDKDSSNNDTETPMVTGFAFRDSPKVSTRLNTNFRLDFKLSPNAWFYTRLDYNSYEARFYSRDLGVNLATTTAGQGTINAVATNSATVLTPTNSSVEYSWNSQTSQVPSSATASIGNTSFHSGGGATNKHGATVTWTTHGEYTTGAFKADGTVQYSRATNWYSDLPYGFFWGVATNNLTGIQLRYNRNGPDDMAVQFTQVAPTASNDWRNLGNYRVATSNNANPQLNTSNTLISSDRASDDEKYTGLVNFKYAFDWKLPVVAKWGASVNESARNLIYRKNNANYTFVGPDGLINTADDGAGAAAGYAEPYYRMNFDTGSNVDGMANVDRFAMARTYAAHPNWFVGPNEGQLLLTRLTNRYNLAEQIDSAYFQTTLKFGKATISPGVRYERTRTKGKGPNDIGNRRAQLALGNPGTTTAPNAAAANYYDYVLARYGASKTAGTNYGDFFTYLHCTYDITKNLVARASFHDSITRPDLANIFEGYTVTNDTAVIPTANLNNPDLQPEYARSINLDIEYYFGRGGVLSLGVFRTDMKQLQRRSTFFADANGSIGDTGLIYTDLANYQVSVWDNVAKSHNTGFELNYSQPLIFLPGMLSGLSFFFNETHLVFDDWTNYLGSSKDISNGGLSYQHKKIKARFSVNRTGYHRDSNPAAAGAQNAGIISYTRQRTMCDLSFGYALTSNLSFDVTGRNVFNEPLTVYSLSSDVITRQAKYGALWTVGITGKY